MADMTTLYNKHVAALVFSSICCNTTRLHEYIERFLADIKSIGTNRGWSLVFYDVFDLSKAVLDMKGNRTTDVSIIFK